MSVNQNKKWYQKTWVMVLGGLFGLGVVNNIINPKPTKSENAVGSAVDSATKIVDAATKTVIEKPKTNWIYSEDEDKMTNKMTKYAIITADEELQFKFPYDGGSTATLQLRKKGGLDIILSVSKGQFTNSYSGGSVRVKFGDSPAKSYSISSSSSGSSDLIFINQTKDFVSRLKSANKIIIEAEFYQEGNKLITFQTAGFDWK
jgi:hypothetical protein